MLIFSDILIVHVQNLETLCEFFVMIILMLKQEALWTALTVKNVRLLAMVMYQTFLCVHQYAKSQHLRHQTKARSETFN